MTSLRHLFQRYTGAVRGWKAPYVLFNLLNAGKLRPNRALYKRYGLKKSVFAPIGLHDFKQKSPDVPWLDRPDAKERLSQDPAFLAFDPEIQNQILRFVDDGYMTLKGFFSPAAVQRLNAEIERLLAQKKVGFNYTGRKIMDSFRYSPVADKEFFRRPEMLALLNFLMGRRVVPFQTIHFIEGSEQRPHSDSIHMTTEPQGYLVATWTALESVGAHNGPLCYYPGSHRLPYVACTDYPSGNTRLTIGAESNKRYEDHVESLLKAHGFERKEFYAEPGDVLIWHANLVHGGSPILSPGATRKSMVAHYFCEDAICFHEMTQRPALLTRK
jgi:hypothetical protein